MKLAGKKAVVTGASQGLGRDIAMLFAKEGADLLLCARNGPELKTVQHEIQSVTSSKVLAEAIDISLERDVHRLASVAEGELGGVDVSGLQCRSLRSKGANRRVRLAGLGGGYKYQPAGHRALLPCLPGAVAKVPAR